MVFSPAPSEAENCPTAHQQHSDALQAKGIISAAEDEGGHTEFTIHMQVRNPILGFFFGYRGEFGRPVARASHSNRQCVNGYRPEVSRISRGTGGEMP